jgi:outer membrane protein assembly factor BamB
MKATNYTFCLLIIAGMLINLSVFPQKTNPNIWPNFRGTNCSGIALLNQDPPTTFSPDKNVLWKIGLPGGHSSPCIWGDRIFISGYQEEGKLLKMLCIDRKSGKIKWEENIPVEAFEKFNAVSNPATATPTTDGEGVYFYFCSFGLICYDFNGKLQWKLPMAVPKSYNNNGIGTSPVIAGDLVILNCFGHLNNPRLLAVNKYDGKTTWEYSLPNKEGYSGNSSSTPVIYKDQVIIYRSADVAGYNLKTGDLIWRFAIGGTDAIGTPVIQNDILYIVAYTTAGNPDMRAQFPNFKELITKYDKNRDLMIDKNEIKDFQFLTYPEMPEISTRTFLANQFGAFDKNKNGLIDSTEWKAMDENLASLYSKQGLKAIKLGGQGDISLTNYLWGNTDQISHISSPLYYNKYIYMIRDGGIISCFNSENGKLLYRGKLNAPGAYFSSAIVAKDRIYIASRNGIVTVFDAGEKLNILAQNNLGELITATPAVADDKLYLRTEKALYAFGK